MGIIEVHNVSKCFDGSRLVLDGVSLTIEKGETAVILGGSGSGKSTLLRLMVGITEPTEGEIHLFGHNMTALSEEQRTPLKKRFGMLFQSGALYNSMTVGENVALPLQEHSALPENVIKIMVKMKLELVGLRDFEHLYPPQISGGMKKRVGLARAIALDPAIVFFDEPSAGLDPITTSVIDKLIMDLDHKMNMTNVVVTHDMASAFRIADRIFFLHQGKIMKAGTPQEIRASDDPLIKQFVEGRPDGPIPWSRSSDGYIEDLLKTES